MQTPQFHISDHKDDFLFGTSEQDGLSNLKARIKAVGIEIDVDQVVDIGLARQCIYALSFAAILAVIAVLAICIFLIVINSLFLSFLPSLMR